MQARILDGDKLVTTTDPAEIRAALAADRRVWIDLERQTPDAEQLLAEVLRLHPLTIEDIWAERLQPKIDDFDAYLYVIVHGIGAARHDRLAGPRPVIQDLFGDVQRNATGAEHDTEQIHASAQRGVATAAETLPHSERIQHLFGRHDISGIEAHTGADAATSAREIGAKAYATGDLPPRAGTSPGGRAA